MFIKIILHIKIIYMILNERKLFVNPVLYNIVNVYVSIEDMHDVYSRHF